MCLSRYRNDAWAARRRTLCFRVLRRAILPRRAQNAGRGRGCRAIAPYCARRVRHVRPWVSGKNGQKGTGAQLVRLVAE
jgi:hypothetical protein